jgi:cytidylate kinase
VIIAVDGPAASGKGTLGRRLARHYGLAFLDTGALYRAAALRALAMGDPGDPGIAATAAASVTLADLDDPRLREERVGAAASVMAAIPEVRRALLEAQRQFAHHPPEGQWGAVLDGRDIGTVVCPDADVKLYVTATAEARAMRRVKELQEQGTSAIYGRVLQDMKARDARDSGRAAAPLTRAADAFELDTTALDADGAFAASVAFITRTLESRKS